MQKFLCPAFFVQSWWLPWFRSFWTASRGPTIVSIIPVMLTTTSLISVVVFTTITRIVWVFLALLALLSGNKLSPHIIYGHYPTMPLEDYSLVINERPSLEMQVLVAHALIINAFIPAIHHWNPPRND
ncbi:hypothetical protein C0995_004541, partial [Termitomyces sp. Mi166